MYSVASRTILILGFTARTSYAAAMSLLKRGATIIISDTVDNREKRDMLEQLSYRGEVINELGNQSPDILDNYEVDIVMPSPGVPLTIDIIQAAVVKNIEVIGDIEMFYRLYPELTYVAITGTDGKTTTTTLTHQIVRTERDAWAAGNIGTPIFELDGKVNDDSVVILELSSFQLEEIDTFHPRVAAFLNVASDHMDRYPDLAAYIDAKKQIFKNMDRRDTAIVNLDCSYYQDMLPRVDTYVQLFSRADYRADAFFDGQTIFHNQKPVVDTTDINLIGVHNMENIMAAVLMARSLGVSEDSIRKVLAVFRGLEHRLEFVSNIQGVEYYNDSKSTTVNSLEKALESFQQPVILIAGGKDKGLDFSLIRDLAQEKLVRLILIGEAADKIEQELDFQPSIHTKDLEEAVREARASATPGDVVLLSPGCASFDMFENYEERGKVFKKAVTDLMQEV